MYARVKIEMRRMIKEFCTRSYSVNFSHVNTSVPKSFKDIPGPTSLPVIGTLYKYLPFIGK